MSVRAAAVLCMVLSVMSLNTDIPSGQPECFFLESPKYKEGLSLNYQVLRGMGDELVTTMSSPSGITLFHKTGPTGRFVSPVPEDGIYRVCFAQNTLVNIRVGFSFHADDPAHDVLSNADATKIEQARAVEDMVYELNTHLDTVKDTQSYMKAKAVYHHSGKRSSLVLPRCSRCHMSAGDGALSSLPMFIPCSHTVAA
ncbi:hypothetical protein, variant [Aphanomyces invadans]|uniref:GOLD domain-containing protein n=1 Tax=Aphanomyces invadans TaxID=157072 RepID=A0A024TCV7_9STRA|nr:hypothetical protein, variant [Aphanomyces invadans]ETV91883.1 hypothetical protein, variant [Aphanomyces invadans]|eukprot:XP_008879520.1 hypothetical protein, variant [Aphanomyces invadans]